MKFIDEGGFSDVYLNEDGLIYKFYDKNEKASKVLFRNEIMIMERLRHKQIPKLIRYDKNELYIVMTRCNGKCLDYILNYYILSKDQKKHIAIQVVEIIMYLHTKDVLYLDLKPENIIVDLESMETYLIDFNISMLNLKKKKVWTGTYGFMSPEVMNGLEYSYPADVYSFGVLLYVIYSQKKVESFGQFCFSIPYDIRRLIAMCTKQNPNSRPTFIEILKMLKEVRNNHCCSIQ